MRKLTVSSGISIKNSKPIMQAKRVAPPAVPDVIRHSGSVLSCSSTGGYGSPIDDTTSGFLVDTENIGKSSRVSVGGREPLTHKTAVFYHQQLALQEDQGIDLTRSPGRDSPCSSSESAGSVSRHSTASLDSGRASSYHTQLSSTSRNGDLLSPRCSVSSCSIGSDERADHEQITDWLREFGFDEYGHLFSVAGYDMATIARMTPEDLTAIGIKKPHHRERIKQQLDSLNIVDNLPNCVPDSIIEWLHLLRLDEYAQTLLAQGYEKVQDVTKLPWEDMEDIGIIKLGHQKKLLLAIKRVKDILSGKCIPFSNSLNLHVSVTQLPSTTNWCQLQQERQQKEIQLVNYNKHNINDEILDSEPPLNQDLNLYNNKQVNINDTIMYNTLEQIKDTTWDRQQDIMSKSDLINIENDFVLVKHPWRRSCDDGDITPTNEIGYNGGNYMANDRISSGHHQYSYHHHHHHHHHHLHHDPHQYPASISSTDSHNNIKTFQQQQQPISFDNVDVSRCLPPPTPSLVHGILNTKQRTPPEIPIRTFTADNNQSLIITETKNTYLSLNNVQNVNISLNPLLTINNKRQNQHVNNSQQQKSSPSHSQQSYNSHQHHHHVSAQSEYGNFVPQIQQQQQQRTTTVVEIHAEKSTLNSKPSCSSNDSIDVIPFANDNAGTIKQRVYNHRSSLSSSSSTSSLITTVSSTTTSTATDLESKLLSTTDCSNNSVTLSPLIYNKKHSNNENNQVRSSYSLPTTVVDSESTIKLIQPIKIDSNILNDIGDMLANLTDELDAMLEEEKRAGLNDSE